METVDLARARASLGQLITRAAAGESFLVTRYGKLLARIIPAEGPLDDEVVGQALAEMAPPKPRSPLDAVGPSIESGRGKAVSSWADRNPAQSARDAILGGARRRGT